MNLKRVLRHYLMPPWWVRRAFPAAALARIETAIREVERTHAGQIRFVVESALTTSALLRGQPARTRAIDVFSQLRVWDTERNNGVLIYVLFADRDVEIVADRGIHEKVGAPEWERICREMEQHFRLQRFEQGAIDGVRAVGALLARHYPGGKQRNELPDAPLIL